MKFAAIVGMGPNDVKITSLIFSSVEKAQEFLKQEGLEVLVTEESPHGVVRLPDAVAEGHDWEIHEPFWHKFFTGFYGGCGGCYSLKIMEVEEGKPFVRWDLD
jgi:hypothetical protein